MSVEIDVENGDASWPRAKTLFDAVWPPKVVATLPWRGVEFANPDLRVFVETEHGLACHVGLYRRMIEWDGRKVHAGGVGGVITRPDLRGRGYATTGLGAAIQTFRQEGSIEFVVLFCAPEMAPFYHTRGWKAFEGEVFVVQGDERVRFDAIAPQVFDLRRKPRQGMLDLCGLPW